MVQSAACQDFGWPKRKLSELSVSTSSVDILRLRHLQPSYQCHIRETALQATRTMSGFIARLFGRQKTQLPPFDFARNPFRAKRKWPPNLRALTEKQQYRFERKFKRRIKLKSLRPQWDKWTKIVQWSLISFVVVYGVLFHDFAQDPMNPRPGEQPFKGIRDKMWSMLDNFYTHTETTLKGGERGARRLEPMGGRQTGGNQEDEQSPKARPV